MSIRTVCPSCRKVYNLAKSMQGKTVRCGGCQSPFAISAPTRNGSRDESRRKSDDRIATSSRPARTAGRVRRDEEDEEPRRRPTARRSRREDPDERRNKNLAPIFIGAGAAALVAIVLLIGGVVLLASGRRGKSDPGVVAANPRTPVAAPQKAAPTPLAANEPPAAPVKNKVVPPPVVPAASPSAGPVKTDEPAVPAGPVPAEMAPEVVKKVKQSTAYLRVTMPNGKIAQGSGFFALERGILITNSHVVGLLESNDLPRSVEVVANSGEAGETKMAGTIVGLDRDNDLAILRIAGDLSRLPPPLPVASANELTETQNVYIFGFPFGAQLGKNITISRSSISSLRRDNGVLKQVQVNGGMNPGNSGGPVADTRGAVVGVSVAGISGTQINFAIPADFIRPLVERSKTTPLDLSKLPPPVVARNDPPTGPAPIRIPIPTRGLAEDLAAMKGTWESNAVTADDGKASGSLKLSINPSPNGGLRGRVQIEIATKQGGTTTSSRPPTYTFVLQQDGVVRYLITNVNQRRGMVFVYYFNGDQLVLSGKVVSSRLAYTLKNVTFRRTSTEPEIAAGTPAAGSKSPAAGAVSGKGSPAGLKFHGDVFSFVAESVRDKRLVDVDIRGFTLGKDTFRDVCEEGGFLIGFQIGLGKSGNNDVLKSWRPIYLTKDGEKLGKWQGPASPAPITLKAKPGYVVSGVSVRSALVINGLTLTYAKLGKDGLDLSDTYNSETVGGNGGSASLIGGTGALFVGVTGHLGRDKSPCSLGLVAVLPK